MLPKSRVVKVSLGKDHSLLLDLASSVWIAGKRLSRMSELEVCSTQDRTVDFHAGDGFLCFLTSKLN